ncbi:hypothetical protein BHE74_00014932 [Ensete ventricosum]|nr:hypothetical protein BHE74_00014932 [Ensete ventricosum]
MQITSLYGGPLEFLFIVESTDDPAYRAVSLLISDFQSCMDNLQDNIDAKVIVAGLSTTCSQKIHNQLVCKLPSPLMDTSEASSTHDIVVRSFRGNYCYLPKLSSLQLLSFATSFVDVVVVHSFFRHYRHRPKLPPSLLSSSKRSFVGVERMHKESKYVLFLDDDVRLHPGSIGALTSEMEKNPEVLNLLKSTHHSLLHGICNRREDFLFVGRLHDGKIGILSMHAEDFRKDLYGVVSGLRDGGYSDDMTLAAIAGNHS